MKLRNVPTSAALAAALVFSSQQVYAAEGKLLLDQLVALAGVEGTKITWGFDSDLGMNPIARWMGLMFDSWIGADYETGLANLKNLVEG